MRVIAIAALSCGLIAAAGQASTQPAPAKVAPPPASEVAAALPVFATDLVVQDGVVGTGPVAATGQTVDAHYTGWLYDPKAPQGRGKKFDSSLDRGKPISFTLGAGRVIMGWELGVAGMRAGGKRTLIIPARLAYGERNVGNGLIPPNSALIFDIELIKIQGEAQAGTPTTAK